MAASRYPKATWLGNGKLAGSYLGNPWRVILHTTETLGLPGYALGLQAPHLTYNPRLRTWVQHFSLLQSARALKRVSIQTNRANAIQVEIVCYSDGAIAKRVGGLWVRDLTPNQLGDIDEFLAWTGDEFGVGQWWPNRQAFNYAQANAAGFRMSPAAWSAYHGVAGHQHVPTNSHWDPGAFNWKALFQEDKLTITQARIEVAALWHARSGLWMHPQGAETAQDRLGRLALEVVNKVRTAEQIASNAPLRDSPIDPTEKVPAWVVDSSIPF